MACSAQASHYQLVTKMQIGGEAPLVMFPAASQAAKATAMYAAARAEIGLVLLLGVGGLTMPAGQTRTRCSTCSGWRSA